MKRIPNRRSIIGVDPIPKGLAFVFFEGGELLDWGTHYRNGERDEIAILDRLIDGCAVDILVLEDPAGPQSRRAARVAALLRELAEHARKRGIRVTAVRRYDTRMAWQKREARNKRDMAEMLAEGYPELAPLVPPRRAITRSERARINVFDALSLVLHAYGLPADDLAR